MSRSSRPTHVTLDVTSPKRRVGFFGRAAHKRRHRRRPSSRSSSQSVAPGGCCFFRSRRQQPKSVRFSSRVRGDSSFGESRTPRIVRGLEGVQLPPKRSVSRKTFYTAISSAHRTSSRSSLDSTSAASDCEETDTELAVTINPCPCGFTHHMAFHPEIPIVTAPNVTPGSYEELVIQARSILGTWITMLDRSQSLDEQMTYVGINRMKRMVMNKLAIPFTAVLEENDTLLHAWITTPVGLKHTHASLVGKETFDKDGDLGDWTAITSVVDYPVKWFCESKCVRAMQMERKNPKLGLCYETRVVLPDAAEGKILLYNLTLHPPEGSGKGIISVDRLFRLSS
eukprot:Blabericola_migrator_1__7028@NODE_3562_length_1677_cov_544_686957_g2213_i0_p1_GENE_NODE_3562_length_1677_cov_544_686957_g2213_i0NODE_3562_length_1677_cov_544_686957_g2213_i0_p1_ORF_typecomplete_len340_score48_77Ribosomal_L24e/PF01246_20/1_8e03Ribosomal_L24e/PF01246_20/0_21_NODE_3562_length_1677_cov_544_686957_g2213_i02101229